MASLSDLDVSCNEISFLPSQIGDLVSLKYLDLRRNLLVELPPDLCELQGLRRLDISENRIQALPSQIKHMALTEFFCDHNPLVTPPAAVSNDMNGYSLIKTGCLSGNRVPRKVDYASIQLLSIH